MRLASPWNGILLTLVFLGGCAETLERFYPLEEHRRWEYGVSGSRGGEIFATTSVVVNLQTTEVSGRNATPQRAQMFGSFLTRFLSEDPSGVFELAQQSGEGEAIQPLAEPNFVLKAPLRVGTQWSATWQSAQATPPVTLATTKTIASVDTKLSVPAGTFGGCLVISINGAAPLPGSETGAVLQVEGQEWYAPGVGYVKGVFRETVTRAPERTAEMTFELQSYGG